MNLSRFGFLTTAGLAAVLASTAPQDAIAARKAEKSIEEELRLREGDETGNEVKALKTEMLVMRSERQALAQLEKLRVRYKGTRMEAEILFRLGEIHMRRARSERFFEVHRDSAQVVRFAPELVKTASEVSQIKRAVGLYLDIQKRFPRFRALDTVTFNAAYAYQQIGDDKLAEAQFKTLLSKHPGSSLVPDSLLSLGEIYYSRRQFPVALEFFSMIKAHAEARVFPYGLYKAAWCRYNMQDASSAMGLLEEVVAFGHAKAAGSSAVKLDLRKEALGDLALFYSEARKPEAAVEYFVAQARDLDAVPFILRLVELYKRHSKYSEVDTVLRQVLDKRPGSTQIAAVHEELIWNADRLKRRDVAAKQLLALVKACESFSSKSPERLDCDGKTVDVAKKLGAKLHAFWKKERSSELAELSLQTYEVYLKGATVANHELAQVRYAYADLLFAQGRFRDASANYDLVHRFAIQRSVSAAAKRSPPDLMQIDPKLAVDAHYGAVVALERAVGEGKWSDSDEETFSRLGDLYLTKAPKGPYALDVRFKKGFIAYEKENYEKAAPLLKAIGWDPVAANHPKVGKAQDLFLDILNIRKDYRGLKEAAQALLVRTPERGREEQLAKIRREAWFAEVAELEQKGESKKAVVMYKAFATENPEHELGPRAWWNASQILFKTGEAKGGADMCAQMPTLFPSALKAANTKDCLTQAAKTYEALARLDLAARVLLNLADVDSEKSAVWRELSIDFMALSGQRENKEKAIAGLLKSATEKPADAKQELKLEKRDALLEKALALAEELGDSKWLAQVRGKIDALGAEPAVSRFAALEAQQAYDDGDSAKAFALAKKVVGREAKHPDVKRYAAQARFIQARILEDEYRAQSVKARVERMGVVLALKTERLEKAQKAYQSAAKLGDPAVAIDSWGRLAELYLDYASTVKGMKLPADVPESDQKTFQAEIEQIVLPMEEKGIEALNQAVEAAKKHSLLDGKAGQLQARLDRLNLRGDLAMKVEIQKLPRLVPGFKKRLLGWSENRRGEP